MPADIIPTLRKGIAKAEAPPKKKKGGGEAPPPPPKVATVALFVAERFGGWQESVLIVLQSKFDAATKTFAADTVAAVLEAVKSSAASAPADSSGGAPTEKVLKQLAMPFTKFKMDEAATAGAQVRFSVISLDLIAMIYAQH
jgi:leucyl-tRNA synthetase